MSRKIPPELWAEVKAQVELGKLTDVEISEKYKINANTLYKKIKVEGWVRGKLIPRLQETIAERNLRIFADAGVTPTSLAKKMAEVINGDAPTLKEIYGQILKFGMDCVALLKVDEDNIKAIVSMITEYGNSKQTVLQYIQETNRMLGNHAPQKREITGKDGGPVQITNTFKNMSDQELENSIKSYMRKFGMLQNENIA